MTANVVVAPIASAVVDRLPRRAVLVGLDLVRCGVVLVLPFVGAVWQVVVLVVVLQVASASFTPAFQAVIPLVVKGNATTRGRCRCRGWRTTWSRSSVRCWRLRCSP
ncbi:hypothetical protein ACFQV2_11810 [Actinokineospora soli]|uniref:Major Facilitator Superfamily protein n=1 Tax=Actinokineospora soli TaxID=1048753 RepID=A0ABW2TK75_9PSEU